ncbi:Transposase DDE domain-containing protein, partial [Streptomyces sp. DconLS]
MSIPRPCGPTSTRPGPEKGQDWPGEAIGRSRGGLTTKIHLACDGQGRPLAFTITAGNVNDCTQFEQVM